MIKHFFYWGNNQVIVQRVLAARSSLSARAGIVAAGYLKLLIPFVSVVGGMAAGHLFQARVDAGILPALPQPDDAFPLLVQLIVPAGYGLIGLVTAGLIGAILSSLDSLMNSGATLFTFDFYKRFMRRDAGERELLLIGRICIVLLVVVAGSLAALAYTENQSDNFFLRLANQTGHLQPGIVVAFLAGVLWRGATRQRRVLSHPRFAVFLGVHRTRLSPLGERLFRPGRVGSAFLRPTAELLAPRRANRPVRERAHCRSQPAHSAHSRSKDGPLHVVGLSLGP